MGQQLSQRQWINVVIISLSFTTFLFLFAHQQLIKRSETALEADPSEQVRALVHNHAALKKIVLNEHNHKQPALLEAWQTTIIDSYQLPKTMELTAETTPLFNLIVFFGSQTIPPIVYQLYDTNQLTSNLPAPIKIASSKYPWLLYRTQDHVIFPLSKQTYSQLIPKVEQGTL